MKGSTDAKSITAETEAKVSDTRTEESDRQEERREQQRQTETDRTATRRKEPERKRNEGDRGQERKENEQTRDRDYIRKQLERVVEPKGGGQDRVREPITGWADEEVRLRGYRRQRMEPDRTKSYDLRERDQNYGNWGRRYSREDNRGRADVRDRDRWGYGGPYGGYDRDYGREDYGNRDRNIGYGRYERGMDWHGYDNRDNEYRPRYIPQYRDRDYDYSRGDYVLDRDRHVRSSPQHGYETYELRRPYRPSGRGYEDRTYQEGDRHSREHQPERYSHKDCGLEIRRERLTKKSRTPERTKTRRAVKRGGRSAERSADIEDENDGDWTPKDWHREQREGGYRNNRWGEDLGYGIRGGEVLSTYEDERVKPEREKKQYGRTAKATGRSRASRSRSRERREISRGHGPETSGYWLRYRGTAGA